jgi:hypothetical protein
MRLILAFVASSSLVTGAPVWAHGHSVARNGQQIANGQNHPDFLRNADGNFESCEENPHPSDYGPAWYGLETAHHGPDRLGPGRGDGCYEIEGGFSPRDPRSDQNPAIN